MTTTFDHQYDVVVVGTGAAGLATALGAADDGLSVLLLESTGKWGGNTAMSGGGMWLPNNPLMQRDGAGDSRAEALEYMEATVGEEGRATSRPRKEAFVDGVADFVLTSEKYGIELVRAADYADYYPELPGGKIGRGLEVKPFDLKRIGDWWISFVLRLAEMTLLDGERASCPGRVGGAIVVILAPLAERGSADHSMRLGTRHVKGGRFAWSQGPVGPQQSASPLGDGFTGDSFEQGRPRHCSSQFSRVPRPRLPIRPAARLARASGGSPQGLPP